MSDAPARDRQPSVRFAHLTDIHLDARNPNALAGWAAALQSVGGLDPAPAFLVTGGDHIADGLTQADRNLVQQDWDAYFQILQRHNRLPVRPVLGNHDVWGWLAAGLDEQRPGYGKAIALEQLQLSRTYYSFDTDGWHFIVLDNIARKGSGYVGALEEEQLEWLKADLAANTRPSCLFSHIPLLAACVFRPRGHARDDHWHVPAAWMHHDVMPLLLLLREHGVRLCISGHAHMLDRVDFLGMSFICNGSICGRWWMGPYEEFAEGYGLFDLYPDGSFEHQYRSFSWSSPGLAAR